MAWCRWSEKCDLHVYVGTDDRLHVFLVRPFRGEKSFSFGLDEDELEAAEQLFRDLQRSGFKANWDCLLGCLLEWVTSDAYSSCHTNHE